MQRIKLYSQISTTYEMVLRYAHLSSEHLRTAAERIHDVSLPA